jgi:hypothetical protein
MGFMVHKCLPSMELYKKLIISLKDKEANAIEVDGEKDIDLFIGNASLMEEFLGSFQPDQIPQVVTLIIIVLLFCFFV